jgi:hypothetical protein
MRQVVIGPLLLMKNGKLPRGVRKIEYDAHNELPELIKTIPTYDSKSCVEAMQIVIKMYLELREFHDAHELIRSNEAEKYSREYLDGILKNSINGVED